MTEEKAMRTDEDIKKDVIDAMYWDDRVDASGVTVEIDDGLCPVGEPATAR